MKMSRKMIAGVEMVLMVVACFAFAHMLSLDGEVFVELGGEGDELVLGDGVGVLWVGGVVDFIFDKLRSPVFPFVSAEDGEGYERWKRWVDGLGPGELIEGESRVTYSISSDASGAGCCFISKDGEKCVSSDPENCIDTSPFAEGALCLQTSFCEKGCCYDEELGIYDGNVLKVDCLESWVGDANCNMPGARFGCCVLGASSVYETEGQCRVDSLVRAFGGEGVVDWRTDVGEGECALMSSVDEMGACVLGDGICKFVSGGECSAFGGTFNEGVLCTSSFLDSDCEMTGETICFDGRVYFIDSQGNPANIYDSSRVDDVDYWDVVVDAGDSCENVDNENSKGCGNCDRVGGSCELAFEDGFDVDYGSYFCRDTSCLFDGERYENGESWCVYDGVIDDGDDVVGSRHWKYVCSQGVTIVEPCADYRNQICVQTNTFDIGNEEIAFRNSACVANNWRECINLNSEENGLEDCESTLNCRVGSVDIADNFKFDVCLPRYPGGFSFRDERYVETAKNICRMADQTCTVVYAPKTWGGCELVANEGCLGEEFAREMNDFCRGLGDCGGSVNILGEYSEGYKVRGSAMLSGSWVDGLRELSDPIVGQFAEVEDYGKFLEASGNWANPGEAPDGAGDGGGFDADSVGMGLGGIGYAVGAFATRSLVLSGVGGLAGGVQTTGVLSSTGSVYASMGAFSSFAIGASVGMVAGVMIARQMGLSPGGTMLMAVGGAIVGIALTAMFLQATVTGCSLGPIGCIVGAVIGIVLMIVGAFFGGDDCDAVEVEFECKKWRASVGGDDCEKCNGDALRPCSEYRCYSLGAACELINKGTENELCVDGSPDDVMPPIIGPQLGVISEDVVYDDVSGDGFSLTMDGGCIDAYVPLMFGVVTDEPAYCKFDLGVMEFDDLRFDLGGFDYSYNHSVVFPLPDPSHGQSQGANWTGDLSLFVKCVDVRGHESPGFYEVDLCVREGEDRMPPVVRAVEPMSDSLVGFDVSSVNVDVVTNELSDCRWDVVDVDYSLMKNSMVCVDGYGRQSSVLGYVCGDNFSVEGVENVYYVRCMDQPWLNGSGNANVESFVYSLRRPVEKIAIDWIEPSKDFESATRMTSVDLTIQTSGGGEWHKCLYSFSGYGNMIELLQTGFERPHSWVLNRPVGSHKIYVECVDETGDFARGFTEFDVVYDSSAPVVARIWQAGGVLHVVTVEDSECRVAVSGCGFDWGEGLDVGSGVDHVFDVVHGETYYVRCGDEFGNIPSGCSVTVQAL